MKSSLSGLLSQIEFENDTDIILLLVPSLHQQTLSLLELEILFCSPKTQQQVSWSAWRLLYRNVEKNLEQCFPIVLPKTKTAVMHSWLVKMCRVQLVTLHNI